MITITPEILMVIAPRAKAANLHIYAPLLTDTMPVFNITTRARVCAFLAQLAHESDNFNAVKEYASGEAYESRTDLGNTPEKDGDGPLYKGRALIQVTGRNMYKACSYALYNDDRLIKHPELLERPADAVKASCWVWAVAKGLNAIADMPEDWVKPGPNKYTKFKFITVRINGGLNGYAEREAAYKRALIAISA